MTGRINSSRGSMFHADQITFPRCGLAKDGLMKGMVLKIDRGSTHDGPGTRTVVFLKGCPLRCLWCSTPDSQEMKPQLLHFEKFCVQCGRCVSACPHNAIDLSVGSIVINRELCTACGQCAKKCLNNCLKISGQEMTVDEVMDIISRQRSFWVRMPGGVTISGGEVFAQHEFAGEILRRCRNLGIDTNIETSCNVSPKILEGILPYLDHVCCDVKHMDNATHKSLTGVPNTLILANIRAISMKKDLILRFPVIPSCNDDDENIDATTEYVKSLGGGLNRVDLLTYHQMGAITYQRLGRSYELGDASPLSREKMDKICRRMRSRGINATLA